MKPIRLSLEQKSKEHTYSWQVNHTNFSGLSSAEETSEFNYTYMIYKNLYGLCEDGWKIDEQALYITDSVSTAEHKAYVDFGQKVLVMSFPSAYYANWLVQDIVRLNNYASNSTYKFMLSTGIDFWENNQLGQTSYLFCEKMRTSLDLSIPYGDKEYPSLRARLSVSTAQIFKSFPEFSKNNLKETSVEK